MKVTGLDGKQYKLDTRQTQYPMRSQNACKSNIQYECGQVIKSVYDSDIILEECYIPSEKCYLDFFIPARMIAFEIQGNQHDEFNPFFHKTKVNFLKAKNKDWVKKEFCRVNDIELIEVRSVDELKELLCG